MENTDPEDNYMSETLTQLTQAERITILDRQSQGCEQSSNGILLLYPFVGGKQ